MNCLRSILLLLLAINANSATLYVKPSSSGTGTGASVANAIGQASVMASASAGDTLYYCGGFGNFDSILITKSNLTLISANSSGVSNKWSATVVGLTNQHGIYGNDGIEGLTIWGFKLASSYIDGIKNNGNRFTNVDNWVANAGRGSAAWVTNTSGSFTGQGIAFHDRLDGLIERNLVENCGAKLSQDHGMYGNGTNILIRGNVVRTNCAWGMQIYNSPGDNQNVIIEDNLVHDNGTPGYSNGSITFYTYGAKTNIIRNNTFYTSPSSSRYCAIISQDSSSARLGLTNNVFSGDSGYGVVAASGAAGTNAIRSNYNLYSATISGEPRGANDVTGTPTFDSIANARYWPLSGSPQRNIALSTAGPTVDFFGRAQASVTDAGFTQYEVQLADDDSRNLGDGARDPWVREPNPFSASQGSSNMELTWTEINQQHALQYIQRKGDEVGAAFAVIGSVNRGTTTYNDPLSGLTNGVTYSYTATPETSLGNSGGIHAITVSVLYTASASTVFGYPQAIIGARGNGGAIPSFNYGTSSGKLLKFSTVN